MYHVGACEFYIQTLPYIAHIYLNIYILLQTILYGVYAGDPSDVERKYIIFINKLWKRLL